MTEITRKLANKIERGDRVHTPTGVVAVQIVRWDAHGVTLVGPDGCMVGPMAYDHTVIIDQAKA